METIFRFVPDKALASFHYFISDLFPAVGRKTMEHPRVRRSVAEKRCIHSKFSERPYPLFTLLLVAHRDPSIRNDDMGIGHGILRFPDKFYFAAKRPGFFDDCIGWFVSRGGCHCYVHAGKRSREDQGVAHIVTIPDP